MENLDVTASSYNYYPRTMIQLCVTSYQPIGTIAASVGQLTDQTVVWGPVELESSLGIPYALAFIAKRDTTDEYTVVIRGTDLYSWESWTQEDFSIEPPLPSFQNLAPGAPVSAFISQGTFNGMSDLISLRDVNRNNYDIVEFLQSARPGTLYVTGHSLGGTLTPPMFAYLNDLLYGGGFVSNMALWSFAGLTSGDEGFATYFNSLFNPEFPWRIHNTLDIAPFCWYSLDDIQNIYDAHDLHWSDVDRDFLTGLFDMGAGQGYTQPVGGQALQGVFDESILDAYFWSAQAAHQHHSTTYQVLVNSFYPA